jgi:hypothetical protein
VAATLILHTVMAETLGVPVANLPLDSTDHRFCQLAIERDEACRP